MTGLNEVVAKVMFLHVCDSVHGGGGGLWAGRTPQGRENPPGSRHPPGAPPEQTPPRSRHPPGAPRSRHPPREQTPPVSRPPPEQTPPPEADCSIRSMSGQYASYWNAFLFFTVNQVNFVPKSNSLVRLLDVA